MMAVEGWGDPTHRLASGQVADGLRAAVHGLDALCQRDRTAPTLAERWRKPGGRVRPQRLREYSIRITPIADCAHPP